MSLQCRRMPSLLAIADLFAPAIARTRLNIHLRSEGDEIQLVGIASGVDSYPTNGVASSVSDTLKESTQKNFVDILTQDLNSAMREGMTKQADLNQSLLTDLNQYQAPANTNTGGNLSTLA